MLIHKKNCKNIDTAVTDIRGRIDDSIAGGTIVEKNPI